MILVFNTRVYIENRYQENDWQYSISIYFKVLLKTYIYNKRSTNLNIHYYIKNTHNVLQSILFYTIILSNTQSNLHKKSPSNHIK